MTIYNSRYLVDNLKYGQTKRPRPGNPGSPHSQTTSLEPKHGWAIAKRIQQISAEVLQVQQGSLYPALHRLEQQGWIKAHWGETEGGRRAKFYSVTRAGRTQLQKELAQWDRLSTAINLVMQTNEA